MNIGFDLDQVLISYPPIVPSKLINWLYRDHCTSKLSYRIPKNRFEQLIRKVTHYYRLRPPFKKNIDFLLTLPQNPHYTLYLISSRYGFLEKITHTILKRYNIFSIFSSINLNTQNEQPHLFKEKIIKKLKIDLFVDDDLELLQYLQQHCPNTKLFWYNPKELGFRKAKYQEYNQISNDFNTNDITAIKDLSEVVKFLKS